MRKIIEYKTNKDPDWEKYSPLVLVEDINDNIRVIVRDVPIKTKYYGWQPGNGGGVTLTKDQYRSLVTNLYHSLGEL